MAGRENSLKADVGSVFFQEKSLRVYMEKIDFCWRSLDDESFTLSSADMIELELYFVKFGTDTEDGFKTVLCAFRIHQICEAFSGEIHARVNWSWLGAHPEPYSSSMDVSTDSRPDMEHTI